MAAIFLTQATNTERTRWRQIVTLAILLLTSKGTAGVTGLVVAKWEGALYEAMLRAELNGGDRTGEAEPARA